MKKRLEALIEEWEHEAGIYSQNAKDADLSGKPDLASAFRTRQRIVQNCINDLKRIVRDCTHENEA